MPKEKSFIFSNPYFFEPDCVKLLYQSLAMRNDSFKFVLMACTTSGCKDYKIKVWDIGPLEININLLLAIEYRVLTLANKYRKKV